MTAAEAEAKYHEAKRKTEEATRKHRASLDALQKLEDEEAYAWSEWQALRRSDEMADRP